MISVIVPAHNSASTLNACLLALQNQTVPRSEYEVILVDDGSSDGTTAIGRKLGVQVLRQARRGPAAARNLGASVAQGDIILFTDSDCSPAPDWIEQMRRPFADSRVMGAKGVYASRQKQLLPRFIQVEYEDKYRRMARQAQIDFIDTYSAGYRRSLFLEQGGFDIKFPDPSAEDVEFSFRLAKQGHRLVFAPHAVVEHVHATSLMYYLRRKWRYGYWRVWVYQRHPEKVRGDSHTAPELKVQLPAVGLCGLSALLSVAYPAFGLLALGSGFVFLLSTLPLLAGGLGAGFLAGRVGHWSALWANRARLP
ncbi:MAG: glycosyltransferase [Chloroflexi bacterium]|nr:glycosyltransferase [Chloroflexota bacterium]